MSLLDLDEKLDAELTVQFMETLQDWRFDKNSYTYFKYVTVKSLIIKGGRTIGVIMFRLWEDGGWCKYLSMSSYYKICKDPICKWNKGINTYEDLIKFEMTVNYKINQLYGR